MGLPSSPHAVITGAGGGFGRALALVLAREGARLVLSDVALERCEETAKLALEAGAVTAKSARCDVTKIEEVEALAAACEGALDLVVNNAGVSCAGAIGEIPLQDWRWTLDVDLWGVIHGCHVFVPRLRAQGHGHILNVAAGAGLLSPPLMAPYNVAKAGVVALSETLSTELLGTKIGVTAFCPTFFQTDIAKDGRFSSEKARTTARRLVAGGVAPDGVAKAALKAVRRDSLYALPMADGRWAWRLKRLAPVSFRRVIARWAGGVLR